MSNTNVVISANGVKPRFELGSFVIQYWGADDELVYLPICSRCRRPIIDLDSAKLVVEGNPQNRLEPVGRLGRRSLQRFLGEVRAYHFECDSGEVPWTRLSAVVKSDQGFGWRTKP